MILAGAAFAYLYFAPPELLRVADGYAAKIVCSNVFIAGRKPQEVLRTDVQAPGNAVLRYIKVRVDTETQTVDAKMLGLFAKVVAINRPGLGCTLVPDGRVEDARKVALGSIPPMMMPASAPWPAGNQIDAADPKIASVLADQSLLGPGFRAVVVVKDGHIAAEAYGNRFDAGTPLLGWSMAKTITAALIGELMQAGKIGLDDVGLFPEWTKDARKDIKLRDLTAMSSGLSFNEDYGDVTDVTRMLYLEPDMARFAAAQKTVAGPGASFSYSTGTAMMLSRLWMDRVGDQETALEYPRKALFAPLGMTSAILESDERGTLAGSSYVYATARDWARFGQFLLEDGVWNGTRFLPEGFVKMMQTSNGLKGGYSQMLTWLEGPTESDTSSAGLPKDIFWLEGHDGQSIAIVPSARLVVVRMGLTPSDLGYGPEKLVKAILAAATGG